jgi:hypothetical protein
MDAMRPRLEVKAEAPLPGRPGTVLPAPDASFVAVCDRETPFLRLLDPSSRLLVREVALGLPSEGGPRRFLGRSGPFAYFADPDGRVGRFDFRRAEFSWCGEARGVVDLAFSSDGARAWASTAAGDFGAIELREPGHPCATARIPLPGRPVAGTLVLSPRPGFGAVVVRRENAPGRLLVVWSVLPLRVLYTRDLDADAEALAFSAVDPLLFVSAPESSEVLALGLPDGRLARRTMLLGRAVQLAAEPDGRGAWAVCSAVGHLVRADAALGNVPPPLPLDEVDPRLTRIEFSPEGRLAVVGGSPSGALLLLDTDPYSGSYGTPLDRLELGRPLAGAAWSPLADEVYLAGEGALVVVSVDRSDLRLKDTSEHLGRSVPSPTLDNPLFPP